MRRQRLLFILIAMLVMAGLLASSAVVREPKAAAAAGSATGNPVNLYARPAPNFDLNVAQRLAGARRATTAQLAAVEALKSNTQAPNMNVRWNDFGGSPDVLMDFAAPTAGSNPEEAGRSFLASNAAIFGISSDSDLQLADQKAALGGHLLRFQQTHQGIEVVNGGVGLVLDSENRVRMASGPYFRDVNVNTQPTLSAEQAVARVDEDLARFKVAIPQQAAELMRPGIDAIAQQLAPVQGLRPRLAIYPTANSYRLVWKVAKFSTNPFGLYVHMIDAHTGEVVSRKDNALHVQNPATGQPFTGDIYPTYPAITPELKDEGRISVGPDGRPLGQVRATLRKFDTQNMATGVNGTLTGKHALVNNLLATKQPFAQAAFGTWHFSKDDPAAFEARTNEQTHYGPAAEPAEHQDDINAFFFVTYLLEYVDYLHRAGDSVHNRIGQGHFPDNYPNNDVPLPANVHAPNIYLALGLASGSIPSPTDPALVDKALGLDNAIAFNLTGVMRELTGVQSPANANPTMYGHGYLLNDLALEGSVPYHEGMHAITSPIAGLEGAIEGSALNEGQADMWAFTLTNDPSLGAYVVNAHKYRQLFRDRGRDPDSIAYIRSALSTLKYSDIGTLRNGNAFEFEEHRDGEIYMSTMWDVREMLNRIYPEDVTFKRPSFADGNATRRVRRGTEIFERIFLGSMYVLGTTSPDTMVKARDALLVADQALYPSDPTDPAAPGMHRALIEQIFAAKELGINAREVQGDKATISTQVSLFAAGQAAPNAPQNVVVAPASASSNRVTWTPVSGAVAYQVLKRKTEFRNRREPNNRREYLDGDASTTGWRHVAFVSANEATYEDKGVIEEVFAPAGLKNLFDSEYAVRAVGVNSTRQVGFSALSGSALPRLAEQDMTLAVDTSISNVSFAGGVFAFDNRLTNARGANSTDSTIFAPIDFRITRISDPTITVRNADKTSPVPTFVYQTNLPLGASAVKRFEFNDPGARLFTFEAQVIGLAYAGSSGGTGSQTGDGGSEPPPSSFTYSVFRQEQTGVVPAGDPTGVTHGGGLADESSNADPTFSGLTYVDVPITTKSDAIQLDIALSSLNAVDMDLELRNADGSVRLARSAGATATEHIRAVIEPNTNYIVRVVGWAGVASDYKLVLRQFLPQGSPNANAGEVTINADGSTTEGGGGTGVTGVLRGMLRFTVNPLTRNVSVQLLN
jgi:hypothetical protein